MLNSAFQWECQPRAEELLVNWLEQACQANPDIAYLRDELHCKTSTRLLDWLDHIAVGHTPQNEKALIEAGFVAERAAPTYHVFRHPGAKLAAVVMHDAGPALQGIAVGVESIVDFLQIRGLQVPIEGAPFGGYRRSAFSHHKGVTLWVVERRGTHTMEPTHASSDHSKRYFDAYEKWKTRPRHLPSEDQAMRLTLQLAQELADLVGKDAAACIVLRCEREYWEARNRAGQLQKDRQDSLGMGWANHDHHTFRSSRHHFTSLVRLFEILGFRCRERFYAGEEAGWGAQVMENEQAGLVLFLDVDLGPEEIRIDFAHHPLPERDDLGTIGLWCALHGDSVLQAGMHHLEAQFFFDELTQDLASVGIGMMEPFSSFTYLRQAFTKGEQWKVDPARIDKLLKERKITPQQADKFLKEGAVGSHLENLQRREGYKGFNQKNVSFIIKKTDPRHIHTETLKGD